MSCWDVLWLKLEEESTRNIKACKENRDIGIAEYGDKIVVSDISNFLNDINGYNLICMCSSHQSVAELSGRAY